MEFYVFWTCNEIDKYYVKKENAEKACLNYIYNYFSHSEKDLKDALEEFENYNSVSDVCGYYKDYIEDDWE